MTRETERFDRILADHGRECSFFSRAGREVVTVRWRGGRHRLAEGLIGRTRWIFTASGRRRLTVLAGPEGSDDVKLGFIGSSSRGIAVLWAHEPLVYRMRKPWLRPCRIETDDGETVLVIHLAYFPRMRIWAEDTWPTENDESCYPLLGLYAYLNVLLIANPGFHWTTLLARPPANSVARLEAARDDPPRALEPGGIQTRDRTSAES